jgi:hypothetical protein
MNSGLIRHLGLAAVLFFTLFAFGSDRERGTSRAFTQAEGLRQTVAGLKTIDLYREANFWTTGGPYVSPVHTAVTREVVSKGASVIPYLIKRLDSSGYDESVYIVFCLRELRAISAKDKVADLQKAFRECKRFPGSDATLYIETERFLKEAKSWNRR